MRTSESNVIQLVSRVVSLLAPEFEKSKIQFRLNQSTDIIIVRTDEILMEQVLINLLKNALEAVAHDGTGEISVHVEKASSDGAKITVRDNGSGIEPEAMDKIFIPFYSTKVKGRL